jgi:hypothetical protein
LVYLRSVRRLLVAAGVVPSSPILVTLMKEALGSSETSVLTRSTRRNIPEDAILHSHRRENPKSYLLCLPCKAEYMCNMFIRNVGSLSTDFRELWDTRSPLRETHVLQSLLMSKLRHQSAGQVNVTTTVLNMAT